MAVFQLTPPLGLKFNPRCDASHEERRSKSDSYARDRELERGTEPDGRPVPHPRAPHARGGPMDPDVGAHDYIHQRTTNARVILVAFNARARPFASDGVDAQEDVAGAGYVGGVAGWAGGTWTRGALASTVYVARARRSAT